MPSSPSPSPSPSLPSSPPKTSPAPNFFHTHTTTLPLPLKPAYTLFGTSAGHERVCRLFSGCSSVVLGGKDRVAFPVRGYEAGRELVDVAVREAEAEEEGQEGKAEAEAEAEAVGATAREKNTDMPGDMSVSITRQHFTMEESIPLLFGLFTSTVRLTGTLSWDAAAAAALSSLPPSSSSLKDSEIRSDSPPSLDSRISTPTPTPTPTPTKPLYALYESIGNAGIQVWKLRIFTPDPSDPANKTQLTERIEGWAPLWLRGVVQRETRRGHTAHMDLYHTLC